MPTPRDNPAQLQLAADPEADRPHTICPIENERYSRRGENDARPDPIDTDDRNRPRSQNARQTEADIDDASNTIDDLTKTKNTMVEDDHIMAEALSPASAASEPKDAELQVSSTSISSSIRNYSSIDYGIPNTRIIPNHTSSFLRAGSKFKGTQKSDRQNYNVEVEIKSVDMNESELCGYLRIEGLTNDHPTLTTYFEGEIVGSKYTFQTRHESWGANDKTDMQHWGRFSAWRHVAKQAKKPDFHYKNSTQRENMFMRWKESFLVPDHRVREISGASFEGFYYICFNQVTGNISGIYFHSRSEKYQQLELQHVDDKGCYGSIEFR